MPTLDSHTAADNAGGSDPRPVTVIGARKHTRVAGPSRPASAASPASASLPDSSTAARPAMKETALRGRCNDSRHREATILAAAQNIVAHACRWSADQASDALLDAAQHHHLSAVQLARGLLELVSAPAGHPAALHGPAAIAFAQWGPQLVRSHQLSCGTAGIASWDPDGAAPLADRRATRVSAKQGFYAPGCQAMLAAAKGVLVVLLGCDLDAAAAELVRVAGVHELDVVVLAEAVVTVASTRARPQGGGVAGTDVVTDEWGEELCFCRRPVRPRIGL